MSVWPVLIFLTSLTLFWVVYFGTESGFFLPDFWMQCGLFLGLCLSAIPLRRAVINIKYNNIISGVIKLCMVVAGWTILSTLFGPEPYLIEELPSPDRKHSIVITERTRWTYLDTFINRYYAIAEPIFIFHKTKSFAEFDTYPGCGGCFPEKVWWINNEYIGFEHGTEKKYCDIRRLNSLSDCVSHPPNP